MDKQKKAPIKSLVKLLENKDDKVRRTARKSLVSIGKPAITSLSQLMLNSKVHKARWEAAKALGAIDNVKAIPALVKALEDSKTDVVWLAAIALEKFGKVAWHELMSELAKHGAESIMLRSGAHHVLRYQSEEGFNELLDELRKALKSPLTEITPMAAFRIIEKMR